jgi:hypothetical protein
MTLYAVSWWACLLLAMMYPVRKIIFCRTQGMKSNRRQTHYQDRDRGFSNIDQWKLNHIYLDTLYFIMEQNWNRDQEPGFSHGTETGNRVLVGTGREQRLRKRLQLVWQRKSIDFFFFLFIYMYLSYWKTKTLLTGNYRTLPKPRKNFTLMVNLHSKNFTLFSCKISRRVF